MKNPKTIRAIRFTIDAFIAWASRPVLLTVTFPALTPDDACKAALSKLLRRLQKRHHSMVRIWERQKNGTLHAHILVDKWLPVHWVREAAYSCGCGNIDLQFVRKDLRLAAYLTKYLTKRPIDGIRVFSVWSCDPDPSWYSQTRDIVKTSRDVFSAIARLRRVPYAWVVKEVALAYLRMGPEEFHLAISEHEEGFLYQCTLGLEYNKTNTEKEKHETNS